METAEPSLRKRVLLLSRVSTALLVVLVVLVAIQWKAEQQASRGLMAASEWSLPFR
jgi:hypothetical protein